MIRIFAVVYVSVVYGNVLLLVHVIHMSHRWRGAVHMAPHFAPNGAENAVRGATRGRAANSGSITDCETRLLITTSGGAMRFVARDRV